ncbi:MAG: hypothetical protein OEZ34_16840 [Spirochaetia bacterium]|nr:hypothetical protein [Spirochaetia bacterium]
MKRFLYTAVSFLLVFQTHSLYSSETSDSIRIYGGLYSHTTFLDITIRQNTDYDRSSILVGSYSRSLKTNLRDVYFFSEGQIGKHYGIQDHWELNGALFARWKLPIRWMDLSLGLGEGFSLASENPPLENQKWDLLKLRMKRETSMPLLNYIAADLEAGLPDSFIASSVFIRIHHRSGIFGTYCPGVCGSNFVTYGVRVDL